MSSTLESKAAFVRLTSVTGHGLIMDRRFVLTDDKSVMRIGRASSKEAGCRERAPAPNNAFFKGGIISRDHAEIIFTPDPPALFIRDTRSMNGTTVNGCLLKPMTPHRLKPRDLIILGQQVTYDNLKDLKTGFEIEWHWNSSLKWNASIVQNPFIPVPTHKLTTNSNRAESVVEVMARTISTSNKDGVNTDVSQTFRVPESESESSEFEPNASKDVRSIIIEDTPSETNSKTRNAGDPGPSSSRLSDSGAGKLPGSSPSNPLTIDDVPASSDISRTSSYDVQFCSPEIEALQSAKVAEKIVHVTALPLFKTTRVEKVSSPSLSIASDSGPSSPVQHSKSAGVSNGIHEDVSNKDKQHGMQIFQHWKPTEKENTKSTFQHEQDSPQDIPQPQESPDRSVSSTPTSWNNHSSSSEPTDIDSEEERSSAEGSIHECESPWDTDDEEEEIIELEEHYLRKGKESDQNEINEDDKSIDDTIDSADQTVSGTKPTSSSEHANVRPNPIGHADHPHTHPETNEKIKVLAQSMDNLVGSQDKSISSSLKTFRNLFEETEVKVSPFVKEGIWRANDGVNQPGPANGYPDVTQNCNPAAVSGLNGLNSQSTSGFQKEMQGNKNVVAQPLYSNVPFSHTNYRPWLNQNRYTSSVGDQYMGSESFGQPTDFPATYFSKSLLRNDATACTKSTEQQQLPQQQKKNQVPAPLHRQDKEVDGMKKGMDNCGDWGSRADLPMPELDFVNFCGSSDPYNQPADNDASGASALTSDWWSAESNPSYGYSWQNYLNQPYYPPAYYGVRAGSHGQCINEKDEASSKDAPSITSKPCQQLPMVALIKQADDQSMQNEPELLAHGQSTLTSIAAKESTTLTRKRKTEQLSADKLPVRKFYDLTSENRKMKDTRVPVSQLLREQSTLPSSPPSEDVAELTTANSCMDSQPLVETAETEATVESAIQRVPTPVPTALLTPEYCKTDGAYENESRPDTQEDQAGNMVVEIEGAGAETETLELPSNLAPVSRKRSHEELGEQAEVSVGTDASTEVVADLNRASKRAKLCKDQPSSLSSSAVPFLMGTIVGGIGVIGALISLPDSLF